MIHRKPRYAGFRDLTIQNWGHPGFTTQAVKLCMSVLSKGPPTRSHAYGYVLCNTFSTRTCYMCCQIMLHAATYR